MLNELYLTPGETRTVMGGRHNFISGCFFGCNLRILDMFGMEIDRFNSVGNGFKFGNPENICCRLEITNLSIEQDICVYSGDMEVDSTDQYSNFCWRGYWSAGISGEYSVHGVRNLTKKTCKVLYTPRNGTDFRVCINDLTSFCTETSLAIFNTNGDNKNSIFNPYYGGVSSIATACTSSFIEGRFDGTYSQPKEHSIFLPPNKQIVYCTTSVNIAFSMNLKIYYRE